LRRTITLGSIALIAALFLTSCAGTTVTGQTTSTSDVAADERYPDVVEVEVVRATNGSFRFDVTISSPYDSPERYADAWRIVGSEGVVYGIRELLHDHAGEQPFTRSLIGVAIPDGVEFLTVEARDLVNGWGGDTLEVQLPVGG
jgi:hypothetical protein